MDQVKTTAKKMKCHMGCYKRYSVLTFCYTLIQEMMWLCIPLLMKEMLDHDIPSKSIHTLALHLSLMTLLPIVIMILGIMYQHLFMKGVWRISLQMKEKMAQSILYQRMQYFSTVKPGELLNLTSTDLSKFVLYWLSDIPKFIARCVVAVIIFVYLITIDYRIAIINLLAIPLMIFPAKFLVGKVMNLAQGVFTLNKASKILMTDMFDKALFIKSYNLEDKMMDELKEIDEQLVNRWSKVSALDYLSGSISERLVHPIFYGIGFSLGVYFIMMDDLTIGSLIALLGYLPRLYATMGLLLSNDFKVGRFSAEMEKVLQVLDLTVEKVEHNEQLDARSNILTCNGITFAYDFGDAIIESLSFTVKRGDILKVDGPNGCGKSTLLHLLSGMNNVTSGSITLMGVEYEVLDAKDIRERVHLLSQTPMFLSRSVLENFKLVNSTLSEPDITQLLSSVGLDHIFCNEGSMDRHLSDECFSLSGGEQQRLSLALAFAKKADVLLLDEIDASIDKVSVTTFSKLIEDYVEDNSRAVIIVSHKTTFDTIATDTIQMKVSA